MDSIENKNPMITQTIFTLAPKSRGCHLVTRVVLEYLPKPLPQAGLLNLFVRVDMEGPQSRYIARNLLV